MGEHAVMQEYAKSEYYFDMIFGFGHSHQNWQDVPAFVRGLYEYRVCLENK